MISCLRRTPAFAPWKTRKDGWNRRLSSYYLRLHGHEPDAVRLLPSSEAKALLEAASTYAAGRLAEFEARAQDVHENPYEGVTTCQGADQACASWSSTTSR